MGIVNQVIESSDQADQSYYPMKYIVDIIEHFFKLQTQVKIDQAAKIDQNA